MNKRPEENGWQDSRSSGEFKLEIDERELTGGFDPLRQGTDRPARQETAYNRTYATEKEQKAEKKAHKKRDKLKARKNKRVFAVVWLCMVLLTSFTLASYLIGGSNDLFAVGRAEGTTEVEIPKDVTLEQLTNLLYDRGAIQKREFFSLYCQVTTDMDLFEPGVYQVPTNLDYEGLINILQGGNQTREEVTVTFPEGVNALEVAQLLEENDVCTAEDFLNALNQEDFSNYDMIAGMGDASGKYYKLEGYLFPDTYNFYKGEEVTSVIGKMLYNFQQKVDGEIQARVAQSGYSLDQVLVLASIIQNEAANESDMYLVSAVLHNRLSYGADYGIYRLECDSTSFYPYKNQSAIPEVGALDYGRYNTYEVDGLPAGAICNPGMDAINAALKPSTEGNAPYYLYFCHAADGTAYYAQSSDEHMYNRQLAGLE